MASLDTSCLVFSIRWSQISAGEALDEIGRWLMELHVTDSEEGVCVDPGEREAILGTGEPGPPEKGKGRKLVPDSGGEGT
jgi:hypothetical protein